ncbi:MAG: class I SAM-dependent methyltransferase [Sedimentisphaerales bacterium]|nr:class I SAM-dependent methyltransferase [Sedimentisphaerales bacterium]
MEQAINEFLKFMRSDQKYLLDLGTGNGYPASRLLAKRPELRLSLLDCSDNMLLAAKKILATIAPDNVPTTIRGDLNNLKFRPDSFDIIISCCTLQFVRNIKVFLCALRSVVRPYGKLFFAFNDRDDLKMQLIHQLFPGFNAIEQARHCTLKELVNLLQICGFSVVHQRRLPYSLFFPTRSSFVEFVASKPFSGFAFMNEKSFQKGFDVFRQTVSEKLPKQNIVSKGRLSFVIAEKLVCGR